MGGCGERGEGEQEQQRATTSDDSSVKSSQLIVDVTASLKRKCEEPALRDVSGRGDIGAHGWPRVRPRHKFSGSDPVYRC